VVYGGPSMIAGTIENDEAILNAVEEDRTRNIGEIARPLGISSSTVNRVLKHNRQHPYHYIRVRPKITLLEGSSARGY
jgi:predicted transcriptional regulator